MARGLFDQSAATFYPAQRKSLLDNSVTADTEATPGYSPRSDGYLSILGKTLQSISSSLQGDNNYNQRQAEVDIRQQQADQEFQALLMKNAMQKQAMNAKRTGLKSVYTTDADGKLKEVGQVPIGSQVIANPNAPTADMRNQAVTTEQAKNLWNEVKAQSEGLKGGYEGMFEMGKAALNRGKGESGNYQLYTENLPSSAVGLYRALTGDTRLSDADAKARALPLLWEPSQDVSLRTKKNEFIDKMINSRERLLSSGKYKDGVIPLSDLQKTAKEEESGQIFNVGGKTYNIPANKVDAFKKAKGIK